MSNYPSCPHCKKTAIYLSTLEKKIGETTVIVISCTTCSAILGIVNKV